MSDIANKLYSLCQNIKAELSLIILFLREGLFGKDNKTFFMLTEKVKVSFILTISFSLFKREIRESSFSISDFPVNYQEI
ncbi:MAG: hypothetical protein RBR74_06440 [Ignavibacteriaceae bacterium]|jgi:inorganic pyrophosphatase/exopolyphosphatase|nr:hypothetical protein [Ignavibacteriaceae bacterium]